MRITEGRLRNIIRESLLKEARYTPKTLIDKGLKITIRQNSREVYIDCGGPRGPKDAWGYLWIDTDVKRDKEKGGPCLNAWEVKVSEVSDSGMGPLLYDIAMELSGEHGLMPDRYEVSEEARSLWDFYLKRRYDIEIRQLDNLADELTPGYEKDNCDQWTALQDRSAPDWDISSLSKVYRSKGTPTIEALDSARKIDWVNLPEKRNK